MKNKMMSRLLSVILVLCMVAAWALPAAANAAGIEFTKVDNDRVTAGLHAQKEADVAQEEEEYSPTDIVRVSIFMEKDGTIEAGYDTQDIANNNAAMAYRAKLEKEQSAMIAKIEKVTGSALDVVWNVTLAANFISANVTYANVEKIRGIDGVSKVVIETAHTPDVVKKGESSPDMATSSLQIGSTAAYAAGLTGAGSRIAIIDTGLDVEHISFDPDAYLYSLTAMAEQLGMDADTYIESLDLLDAAEIAEILPELNMAARLGDADAQDLYVNAKVPFGFNYVDESLEITHLTDVQGEHGSHVAGIASANAYIAKDGGFVSAFQNTYVQGVAPDAQLIVMKVFGANGGAYDADYMVAIEDAIMLGADAVNLSLGSGAPGMSSVYDDAYQAIFDSLEKCGVVVSISAGNSGAWTDASENGMPYLYLDDVSMHTGGSPGTYTNSMGVASVENDGYTGEYLVASGYLIPYAESTMYGNASIRTIPGVHDYVFLNGIGKPEEFDALLDAMGLEDFSDKIVLCYRGELNFSAKADAAAERGAKAVIIVNTENALMGMDLTDGECTIPVLSIPYIHGEVAFKENPIMLDDETCIGWTGTVESFDGPISGYYDSSTYTMSDFSSWGVPGSLEIKPEIAAPGGNIYSVAGAIFTGEGYFFEDHASFESMDGTSMAAPQVAGMAALMAQYIRQEGLEEKTGLDARTLAQSLLMSTAKPVMDENNGGYYYPVLQQGAGLGNVGAAIMADSYIIMKENATASYADGKVKAELGDDPNRTGVYTFSFVINNLTDEEKVYELYADIFTQSAAMDSYGDIYMDRMTMPLNHTAVWSVNGKPMEGGAEMAGLDFNGDGYVNTADGQTLLDYATGLVTELSNGTKADLNADEKINSYDAYLFFKMLGQCGAAVPANGSAEVTVTITIAEEDQALLDTYYTAGAYIEGYIYAESLTSDEGEIGTCHSIPMLAYYGNWSDPSMYDKGSYWDFVSGAETRVPYLYGTNGIGGNMLLLAPSYDPTNDYIFGGNPVVADETYMPERDAISTTNGDELSGVAFTAIRNAAALYVQMWNAETGELLIREAVNTDGGIPSAYYYVNGGYWVNTQYTLTFGDLGLKDIPENTRIAVGVTMIPEYYVDAEGNVDWDALGNGVTYSMEMTLDNTAPALDDVAYSVMNNTLNVTATDNQYIAGVALFDEFGQYLYTYAGADAEATAGEAGSFALDLSEVDGANFLLQVYDYAGNVTTYELDMNIGDVTDEITGVAVNPETLIIQKGDTAVIAATVYPVNATNRGYTWTSQDESIAIIDENGVVLGVSEGVTVLTATSNADPTKSASCQIQVIDIQVDMNAVIWDEEGGIYFSEFNTGKLPEYTKLSGDMRETDYFASAAVGPNGILYASSFNESSKTGDMYVIDPETWEVGYLTSCTVQGLDIFYSDLTYTPTMFGMGVLLASYGPYVIALNPANGAAIGILDQYSAEIVGIASIGGVWNPNLEVYQDVVAVILNDGTVCLEYYLTDATGGYYGAYYNDYMGGRNSYNCGVEVSSTWYFNSAHYADDYLFWSKFDYQNDETAVTLYALDLTTGQTVSLGTFPENVWPVGGLFQMPTGSTSGANMDQYKVEGDVQMELQTIQTDLPVKQTAGLEPNSAVAEPPACETETVTVDITAKDAQGQDVGTTNGVVTVTYDSAAFNLKNIIVKGDYISVNSAAEGSVTFGYVSLEGFNADDVIATLVLEPKTAQDGKIQILHEEHNDTQPGYDEQLPVEYEHEMGQWYETLAPGCESEGEERRDCAHCDIVHETRKTDPHGHSYEAVITPPTVEAEGYTTHTCEHCGNSYKDTFVDKLVVDNTTPDTGEYLHLGYVTMFALGSVALLAVLLIFRKKLIG